VTKNTILDPFRPTIPLLILPTLHLILCFVVDSTMGEDYGLKWFLLGIFDFPIYITITRLGLMDLVNPFLVFAIFGTLWWYVIGVFLKWISGVGASIANR
jgi:hypothetical protein